MEIGIRHDQAVFTDLYTCLDIGGRGVHHAYPVQHVPAVDPHAHGRFGFAQMNPGIDPDRFHEVVVDDSLHRQVLAHGDLDDVGKIVFALARVLFDAMDGIP